jgi:RNA-directed DNA polymerase
MKDRVNDDIDHAPTGGVGTEASGYEVPQAPEAKTDPREPTTQLMEQICAYDNLNQAYKRVKANKGAAGIDGMTTEQLGLYLKTHGKGLVDKLLDGSYQAQPVREVEIPKPNGGVRQLGIPTVIDRWVQQAVLQVLEPIVDPTFSESSSGYVAQLFS